MKNLAIILGLLLFSFESSFTRDIGSHKKRVTIEDIWQKYLFYARGAEDYNWMKDDRYYSTLDENSNIIKVSILNENDKSILLKAEALVDKQTNEKIKIVGYKFSEDEKKVLLLTKPIKIYRHSTAYVAYVYDLIAERLISLAKGASILSPLFSPDGNKVSFVQENNIYIFDLATQTQEPITWDGKKNEIINGLADWVYEEEFTLTQAYHWSQDGRYLAYLKFDEKEVPEFTMVLYGSLYPKQSKFKYPKAGEKNARVSVHIYDLDTKQTLNISLQDPNEFYIPRITWANEKLAIMKMNRLQNQVEVFLADPQTGEAQMILKQSSSTYIDEPNDYTWYFLKDKSGFFWQSDADGYNHIYYYNLQGQLLRQLTKGPWEVTQIYGVDEVSRVIYFESTEVSPLERHIFVIDFEGKQKKQLSRARGWHEARFSSSYSYYIDEYSTPSEPTITELWTKQGNLIRVLENNADLKQRIADYEISPKEFFSFTTSDNVTLNGWMIKPLNFKKNKKYPVLMYVYGGPGSQMVVERYNGFDFFWYQHLASLGYMVVCVDNRGTGGRGRDFKKVTYLQLGKYETIDQIEAAKYLASLPYVDKTRIGIWGWSFGGYLSSLCLLKGNDVFKAAIAVAPVTNWRYYDTIYTERYLGLPQNNPSGYDENSPIHFVENLKGHYFIIHGTADDNVHFQNAVEMVSALVKAGKQFESFYYPDKNHGIS
ncbi:MAG: S9 family peptidase, partial [Bacteroidia bacterium]|nr:S9 family peptidase [Bacteroidia bacterium]